jgi:hypothetical protein
MRPIYWLASRTKSALLFSTSIHHLQGLSLPFISIDPLKYHHSEDLTLLLG